MQRLIVNQARIQRPGDKPHLRQFLAQHGHIHMAVVPVVTARQIVWPWLAVHHMQM